MTFAVRTLVLGLVLMVLVLPAAVAAKGGPPEGAADKAKTTKIQILGLNDFHGQLEPSGRLGRAHRRPGAGAGGAEYLATHVAHLRETNPNTLFVSAGDLIGATPLLSALFHDEPTIESFNVMKLDYNGVGNHEFDEGVDELLRMQNGGCHPVDGCQDGDGFAGAEFPFLAANVEYRERRDDLPAVRHPQVRRRQGRHHRDDPGGDPLDRRQAGISTVNFFDEADTVNALVPVLKAQEVETFVVLLHQGGVTRPAERDHHQRLRHAPARCPPSWSGWTTPSTWSSPGTPTGPSTA